MVTEAVGDYLKAIFEIAGEHGKATTTSLAENLLVSPASVSGMLRKLSEADPPLIEYQKHHGARLTKPGRSQAVEVVRRHRLLELFLYSVLNYSWDEVHKEAEKLEHAISETLADRIADALGDPETDPHGHQIPRKDGSLPKRVESSLLQMKVGERAVISMVSDRDSEMLQYLSKRGVLPGATIELIEREPFDGPLMLRINQEKDYRSIGPRLAATIHVQDAITKRKTG